MRPSITATDASGYRRSQAIVRPGLVITWTGYSSDTENKVCVRVYIASVYVNHVGLLQKRFTLLKGQLDAVVAWFDLEGEATGVIRVPVLPLAGFDVHDLDATPLNRASALWSANNTADRAIGFEWLRTEIDDRPTVARGDTDQGNHNGPQPNRCHVTREVEAKFPHTNLAGRNCKPGATLRQRCGPLNDPFTRQRSRLRRVVKDDPTASGHGSSVGAHALPAP